MIKKISIFIISIICFCSTNAQLSYFLSNKFWRLKHATIEGRQFNFNESNSNAPTLQFSGGNIRGNGGCNAYHTRFTINGSSLDINPIMSTRMACSDMYMSETDYFKALAQSHSLTYEEGSSEFKLINTSGDELVYFAQFARSGGSYTPPPRREYREETSHYSPRKSRRHSESTSDKKLSKKELARQKLLEKKLNSKKGKKLSKKERRELMALQSKTKKSKVDRKGKKGKADREEKRGGKKGKGKEDKKESKKDKKSKKGKHDKEESKKDKKSSKKDKSKSKEKAKDKTKD